MKFVEDTEAVWSAEQLAAAEAEIEQQKREWELGRLQALKDEEERRARLTDDDDQLLTFSQEDAHNQVNNSTGPSNSDESKKSGVDRSRKLKASGRMRRRRVESRNHSGDLSSASDDQISSDNDIDVGSSFEEDAIEESDDKSDSSGDESYHYGSRNQHRKSSISNNHRLTNPNSPRTRSRGSVSINLWTLDVSPILPGVKPIGNASIRSQMPTLKGRGGKLRKGSGRGLSNSSRSPDRQSLSPRRLSNSTAHSVPLNSPPSVPYSNPNLVIRTRRASATTHRQSDGSEVESPESLFPKKRSKVNRMMRRSESSVEGNGPIS